MVYKVYACLLISFEAHKCSEGGKVRQVISVLDLMSKPIFTCNLSSPEGQPFCS
jgi:hypothetical protein